MSLRTSLAIALSTISLSLAAPSYALYQTIFYDGFDGDLNQSWDVSNGWWSGPLFGCEWSYSEVWKVPASTGNRLNVNFNAQTKKCGEIRTKRQFNYGSFVANMKPLNVAGTVSSFFLYAGDYGGAYNHFEIDIEFVGGTNKLHTNYWINGQQYSNGQAHWQAIDLSQFGVNQYAKFRRYGIDWRPGKIVWFMYDDVGNWVKLREANVNVNAWMNLYMNNWTGDNRPGTLYFPGPYFGGGGAAQYDFIWVGD